MATKAELDTKRVRRAYKAYSSWLVRKGASKLPGARAFLDVYAHSLELRVKQVSKHRGSGGKRGAIMEYSDRSRGRFIARLNRLQWPDGVAVFLTLTYPDGFQDDPARVKDDFQALWKRIERQYPTAAAIWRLEWRRRRMGKNAGRIAPHFHCVVFGVGDDVACLPEEKHIGFWDFVRLAWADIVFNVARGSKADPADYSKHLEFGTDVLLVNSRRHAQYYVAKYMAKSEQALDYRTGEIILSPGRAWGVVGAKHLVFSPMLMIAFSHVQLVAFKLLVEQYLADTGSRFLERYQRFADWMGCRVYTDAMEFARYFIVHWVEPG